MSFSWKNLIKKNIQELKPYSSARDEYTGELGIFLDANESPFPTDFNRYPDPEHKQLKKLISAQKNLPFENMVLGNGSDEIINFLFNATCTENVSNVVTVTPTYGMYKVSADIFGIEYREIPLKADYALPTDELIKLSDKNTKLIFICSPNNPTGNSFSSEDIIKLATSTSALIVVDEAYIDFNGNSNSKLISQYENICVIQTLSKAYGLAGLRIGILVGAPELISYVKKIKAPYNIGSYTQKVACEYLEKTDIKKLISELNSMKEDLKLSILKLKSTVKIYPSDANFILVKFNKAKAIFDYLIENKIIVRDRSKVILCDDCLRITVGNKAENLELIKCLEKYEESIIH